MKDIQVVRYNTLRACFLACLDLPDLSREDEKNHYWLGHNGRRGFRLRIDKWLAREEKVWGWVNYKCRELHVYIATDANIFEVISMLSHEIGHFQRPRYPFGNDEERKAENYRKVTMAAINIARSIGYDESYCNLP